MRIKYTETSEGMVSVKTFTSASGREYRVYLGNETPEPVTARIVDINRGGTAIAIEPKTSKHKLFIQIKKELAALGVPVSADGSRVKKVAVGMG